MTGKATLTEWFSDVPWHQKLGTYAGNEIDVPLIFPYEVLPQAETRTSAPAAISAPEDCMIEVGVANILGMQRIDTLYDPSDPTIVERPGVHRPRTNASK